MTAAGDSQPRLTKPRHTAGWRRTAKRQPTAVQFNALKSRWREGTADLSRIELIVSDANYLGIVALGEEAVPLILSDLQENGGYWFPALEALTGESPETPEERESRKGMRSAWLRWGTERGLIAG